MKTLNIAQETVVKILSIIAIVVVSLYMIFNRDLALIHRFSNGLFIVGFIYFSIALMISVRNFGFFKTLSYHGYRMKYYSMTFFGLEKTRSNNEYSGHKLKDKNEDEEEKVMKFHEFCEKKYKNTVENGVLFMFSIPILIISFLLALMA